MVRTKRIITWSIVVIVVTALVYRGSVLCISMSMFANMETHPTLVQLEKTTHLKFPPSTRVLESSDTSFQDTIVQAKMEMDKKDVIPFIKTIPSPCSMSTKDRFFIRNADYPKWWKPDSARTFVAAGSHHNRAGGGFVEVQILADMDGVRRAVVYLDYGVD